SLTFPVPSLGTASCQRSLPVCSSRHNRMPRSPVIFGLRGDSLFVPTNTLPPATVGLPYDCEPSLTTHFTFLVVAMSISSVLPLKVPAANESGSPFSSETMLRDGVCPHIGQSAARASTGRMPSSRAVGTAPFLKIDLISLNSQRNP